MVQNRPTNKRWHYYTCIILGKCILYRLASFMKSKKQQHFYGHIYHKRDYFIVTDLNRISDI